ncbi:hypothetical protein CONLIGDRAFT_649045 [Coniochaeta ligniaria NRRL 30616]|uniref:Uncharacterized protein n=1 Tax=Coniochaeta ligniaria NRRL 30616 TaxID=1408157 RepID=A0A1J7J9T4_9PEZI|nr:hypothetical protein CONLIGDRAFT_649045 [Coniochaeta ligniaria NRRL 30616]
MIPIRFQGLLSYQQSNVGQFNPDYPDPQDLGIISDDKTLGFTYILPDSENQIPTLLDTLMSGSALSWWNRELSAKDSEMEEDCQLSFTHSAGDSGKKLLLLPASPHKPGPISGTSPTTTGTQTSGNGADLCRRTPGTPGKWHSSMKPTILGKP